MQIVSSKMLSFRSEIHRNWAETHRIDL